MSTFETIDDEGLARLLDQYPRDQLGVFTMGEDPKAWTTWRKGAAGNYLISLWRVWRLRWGLYFFFSMRSVTVFLFRNVR